MLKGRRWRWYAVMAGCVIAAFLAPQAIIAPWLWTVTLWSQLGTRERRFGTAPIVFSAPSPARAQLFATYAGAVAIASSTRPWSARIMSVISAASRSFCRLL